MPLSGGRDGFIVHEQSRLLVERSEKQDRGVQFADVLGHRQQLMGCDAGAVQHRHWREVVGDVLGQCRLAARNVVANSGQAGHVLVVRSRDGLG